jgi:hypothetical protein
VANDSTLQYGFVLKKTILDFCWRHVDAGYFQHVVSAAVIPVVTFLIDMKLITGSAPIARKRFF